jgi:prepilin-type N-terminal cleavage/methylation domain-containing protein
MLPEQKRNAPAGPPRRGITLIELLVVMFILLMLTTVALPMLQPDDDSRRIREAARMVNVYLSSARLRAMETGGPRATPTRPSSSARPKSRRPTRAIRRRPRRRLRLPRTTRRPTLQRSRSSSKALRSPSRWFKWAI